jgi:hypothetical protein
MKKKYQKAKVVAKNNPQGSFAAGCPSVRSGGQAEVCHKCELVK